MMIRWLRFNIYLVVALAAALSFCCGCHSPEGQRKKVGSTMRFYMEVSKSDPRAGEPVPVYREHPVMIRVEKAPFLGEGNIKSARVIDIVGGFALSIEFDKEGGWLFEQYTTSNKGRRVAVFSRWMTPPEMKLNQGRWLAAPKLTSGVSDAVFTFTPDATRDEAELIAQGLNNLARKAGTGKDDL
jgi:hypothetical protein